MERLIVYVGYGSFRIGLESQEQILKRDMTDVAGCLKFGTHLMKILAAPVSSLPSSMSVENGKETLSVHSSIIKHVRMRVFHRPPGTLLIQHADPKSRLVC